MRLTATLPAGPTPGYDVSFRDVLPPGVSYVPGSAAPGPEPTVLAGPGATTLLWRSVADLAVGGTVALAFRVGAAPASFEVGDLVTGAAQAFAGSDPQDPPAFTAAGVPVPDADVGTASASAATRLTALEVREAGPAQLLRGLHDHQDLHTLTATTNTIKPTTDVTLEQYLPAALEFLGCPGAEDHTTASSTNPEPATDPAEEYPDAGHVVVGGATPDCRAPTSVETVSLDPDGAGPLPDGVYTKVAWTLGDLGAGTSTTLSYRAAVPIRRNAPFAAPAPTPASGDQAVNLDNNTGAETYDEEPVDSTAVVRGTYSRAGVPVPVRDQELHTATAEDLLLDLQADGGALATGQLTRWTLRAAASEYRRVDDVRLSDTVPDGLCPLDATARGGADCAAGPAPSDPYGTIQAHPDGTWTLGWDADDAPQLARIGPNQSASVAFTTRTRASYAVQHGGAAVRAGDSLLDAASVLGRDHARCSGGTPDCTTGTPIFHQEVDGVDDADAATAGLRAAAPSLEATAGRPVGGSCTAAAFTPAALRYVAGDRVCFRLRLSFPAGTATRSLPLVDVLPPNVRYDPALPPTLTGDPVLAGTAFDPGDGDVLRWTLPDAPPGAGVVFEVTFAGRVLGSPASADGARAANRVGYASLAADGTATPLGGQIELETSVPLRLLAGVRTLDGDAARPADTDGLSVDGGDAVEYRLDLADRADRPATATEVRAVLPAGLSCADVGAISDAGTCPAGASTVTWTDVAVPAAGPDAVPGTRTLTYTVSVPVSLPPATALPITAGVGAYLASANTGEPTTFVPADNVDPAAPGPNAPPAGDDVLVTTRGALSTQTVTTGLTEAADGEAEATIGEQVDYVLSAVLPRHASLGAAALSVAVPAGLRVDAASVAARLGDTPLTTTSLAGTLGAALPAGTLTGATDTPFELRFSAVVTDSAVNVRGRAIITTGTFTAPALGGPPRQDQESSTTTLVEPQVALTAADDGGGAPLTTGQVLTTTLEASDGPGAGVSTAHDATLVATVPAGLVPLADGTDAPAADGDQVAPGAVWAASARTVTTAPTLELAPGASRTIAYRARVAAGVAAGSSLATPVALGATSLPGASPDERSAGAGYRASVTHTVQVAQAADLSVAASASGPNILEGQTLDVTLVVQNAGPSVAQGARVVDTLPAGLSLVRSVPGEPTCLSAAGAAGTTTVSCTLGALAPGAQRTLTLTVRAGLGVLGRRATVAVASSTTPDPVPANGIAAVESIVGPAADLALAVSAPPAVAAGDELTWTLRVSNRGPSPAQGVRVRELLPEGTGLVRALTPAGSCSEQAGTVDCALGTLAADDALELAVTGRAPFALAGRTLAASATVSAQNGDPVPANDVAAASTTVGPAADLSVLVSGPAQAAPGQLVASVLLVTNRGPSAATGVTVGELLPAGLTAVSAAPVQGSCALAGPQARCALGTLAAGASTQVQVVARVAGDLSPRPLTSSATVAGAEPDPAPADNAASAVTAVRGGPVGSADLLVRKTPSTTHPTLGDRVVYRIAVTNRGPATARDVRLLDALPAALGDARATTSRGRCRGARVIACRLGDVRVGARASVAVAVTVQAPGRVLNSASATAANPDAAPGDDVTVARVSVRPAAARLEVAGRADRARVAPGGVVRWTTSIVNRSEVPALRVSACDPVPARLTLLSAGGGTLREGVVCWSRRLLAPGESFRVALRTRVPRGTQARQLVNTAVVRAANAPRVRAAARVALERRGPR